MEAVADRVRGARQVGEVEARDPVPALGQGDRELPPEPARRAGHECDPLWSVA
ncbi:hypothetical protein V6738_11745 [Actinomadura luteofluorescens]